MTDENKKQLANNPDAAQQNAESKEAIIQAINHIFAQFQLIYNNQYHKAFPTTDKLGFAKKLWFNHLKRFNEDQILKAADKAIEGSSFLPTIHDLLKRIEFANGLPDTRAAYEEACNAPSPKNAFAWSHPVVFAAGEKTGWYFLSSEPETKTFPVFSRHYQKFCEDFLNGEQLTLPNPEHNEPQHQALSREEQLEKLDELEKQLKL